MADQLEVTITLTKQLGEAVQIKILVKNIRTASDSPEATESEQTEEWDEVITSPFDY